ncbi:thioredoxin [Sunxiuqinia elliptica]|uniref:Thioredoxin n=1 Tax=Sunxiuqinia elliptica TaxID=655355 RepID=A0A4R6HBG2_9BACT|nr:thioredoxin [Sunxiuqinia elliptica]TDO05732.1 thioredoxin [Sunxiuqinia elliptica]TDO65274.1 thioredoxin [Sunxiuqinia elliptica]
MSRRFKSIIKSERPVLVDFYADWCEPCKQIPPILKKVKNNFKESVRIIKVNVDNNPFIASHYQVRSIPTLILFKKGDVQWTGVGIVDAGELSSVISQHVNKQS